MKSLDSARLAAAFTGLERAGTRRFARTALAAVLARLGQPAEAWRRLEEDLGRGLLDELAARQDQRLAPAERARLRELTAELERLDKLVESTPKNLDQAERARRFEDLKRQHARWPASPWASSRPSSSRITARWRARSPRSTKSRPRCPPMPRWSPGSTFNPRDRMRPTPTASTGAWSSAHGASRPGSRSRGAVRAGCGPKTIRGWPARSGRSCVGCRPSVWQTCGPWSRSYATQRLAPLAKALGATGRAASRRPGG